MALTESGLWERPRGKRGREGGWGLGGGWGGAGSRAVPCDAAPPTEVTVLGLPCREGRPHCPPSAQGTSKGGGAWMAGLRGWLFWIWPVKTVHILKSFPRGWAWRHRLLEALAPDA